MTGLEEAHHVTGPDTLTPADERPHRFVGRAQPAVVRDAHDAPPRERGRERHHACAGRTDGTPGRTGEVDPAVAGEPWSRRRREPPHHDRPAVERPGPRGDRRPDGHRRPDGRGRTPGSGNTDHSAAGHHDHRDADGHRCSPVPVPHPGRHAATVPPPEATGEATTKICG